MAALENQSAVYYGISNGKFVRSFSEPTAKSVSRVNKNDRTVHEEFYSGLTGYIRDIKVREHKEYGKDWQITLVDESTGEAQLLQFKYSSGYANSFLKALPNVDFDMPVVLIPKSEKINDKTRTTLFINQGGAGVKWFYTKDNPNGLPQLKQVKIKGVTQWDDTEVMEFLEAMVNDTILPRLKEAGQAPAGEPMLPRTTAAAKAAHVDEDDDNGDLPF